MKELIFEGASKELENAIKAHVYKFTLPAKKNDEKLTPGDLHVEHENSCVSKPVDAKQHGLTTKNSEMNLPETTCSGKAVSHACDDNDKAIVPHSTTETASSSSNIAPAAPSDGSNEGQHHHLQLKSNEKNVTDSMLAPPSAKQQAAPCTLPKTRLEIPVHLLNNFAQLAFANTRNNLETAGYLLGVRGEASKNASCKRKLVMLQFY